MKKQGNFLQYVTLIFVLLCGLQFDLRAQCSEDCVWPGDMNANGIANNLDVLAYGIAFGETGPARADATTTWEGQTAEDWGQNLPLLGADYKHIDADGNGVIELNDQFIIAVNYNQTNENFVGLLGNNLAGDDLFLVPQNTVAAPGGSLFFDVHLGTESNPINDLYGIGFQLELDTQYVQEVFFDFSESWVGNDEEYFGFGKYTDEIDHASVAVTRLDGNTVSGFGKIAQIEIVITDVILGLEVDTTACLPFPVQFKNVLAIDAEEGDLMIRSRGDSLTLKHPSQLVLSNSFVSFLNDIKVSPNPTMRFINIETKHKNIERLLLFDSNAKLVFQQNFDEEKVASFRLDTQNFYCLPGVHILVIMSEEAVLRKRVILL